MYSKTWGKVTHSIKCFALGIRMISGSKAFLYYLEFLLRNKGVAVTMHDRNMLLVRFYAVPIPRFVKIAALPL